MADARTDDRCSNVEDDGSGLAHNTLGRPGLTPRELYRAPHLRYLGSVRELTWGPGGVYADDPLGQPTP